MNGITMKIALVFIFSFIGLSLTAQQLGDECIYAQFINESSDYCSGEREFSNATMTASLEAKPSCWPDDSANNDMWFAFRAEKLGFYVSVTGSTQFSSGSLQNPSVAIYSGSCGNLTEELCGSDLLGDNLVELTNADAQIGQVYYIRVGGRDNNVGSFQLCIEEFNPSKAPESDCKDAVLLCDKSPFYVENLTGVGELVNEVANTCIAEEFASVWYKWVVDESGTLEFTISPNNAPDDIDFAVYRLPGGLDDCANKELVRCMASGETIGAGTTINDPCFGPTGLSSASTDSTEDPGCSNGSDNFVAALDMVSGEAYVLIINNFSESGYGFSIDFGGTGTFLGPEPDFEVEALQEFECDKTIQFTDLSSTLTDPIVSYSWNFGAGSNPSLASGTGPHLTSYDSFGDKIAALTIETSRGCKITKVVEFYIDPCCEDLPQTLDLSADVQDISCFGYEDGQIVTSGIMGYPEYQYSIDNGEFQPIPFYSELGPGDYQLNIVDRKGCMDSLIVTIEEPEEIIVYAGQDTTVNLGDEFTFDGSYSPPGNYTYSWDPDDLFEGCTDCLDPSLFPTGTQQYILTVTDENGCFGQDSIIVRVEIIREVDAPNIFSPNGDLYNDFFNIFANKAAVGIEELLIFDRWGNKVYKGTPILNNLSTGWDGRFNGEPVELGVYTWIARVSFLDGEVLPYSGDITVVK